MLCFCLYTDDFRFLWRTVCHPCRLELPGAALQFLMSGRGGKLMGCTTYNCPKFSLNFLLEEVRSATLRHPERGLLFLPCSWMRDLKAMSFCCSLVDNTSCVTATREQAGPFLGGHSHTEYYSTLHVMQSFGQDLSTESGG